MKTRNDEGAPQRVWLTAGIVLTLAIVASGYVWLGRGTNQSARTNTAIQPGNGVASPDLMAKFADQLSAGGQFGKASGEPMFVDVASARGLNHVMASWGLSWNDFNNDGVPDLFVADHMHYPSTLYSNQNGLWFEPAGELGRQVGLDDHQVAFGDVDGDGLEDAFVAPGFYRPPNLFLNRGDGKFQSWGDQSGTRGGRGSGRSSMFVDYTGDGCLDIAAYNNQGADDFYRGLCDGIFADASLETRMASELRKLGATAGDLDGDGDIDFVTFTDRGVLLFMNRGDGTFVDMTDQIKFDVGRSVERMVGGALGDYDNDGDLDLYLPEGLPHDLLFRNRGDGTFEDVSDEAQIRLSSNDSRNAVFADFNNDTWLDLYIVDGARTDGNVGNNLLLNQGDGTYLDVSAISGAQATVPGVPLSPALGDYNQDGLLDIILGNGDGEFQISGQLVLLENRGPFGAVGGKDCGNWLIVDAKRDIGSTDDHSATVEVRLPGGQTLVRQAAPGTRPQAQDAPGIHVGLGCANYAEDITVTWPDGHHWRMQNVPANQRVLAVAGQMSYVRTHPGALLGKVQAPWQRVTETGATRAADAVASPEAITRREDEVLAYALVSRLAGTIRISGEEIEAYLTEHGDKLAIPEKVQMQRMVIGPFTPRRKQPRLDWDVANAVKAQFSETRKTADEIAVELNIRAWGITDPAIGRFWNIPGETRGYAEGGIFSYPELVRRFGSEQADRVFNAAPGRVFGPLRQPELDEVFEPGEDRFVPDTLNLIKVGVKIPRAEASANADGWRIKRALERTALAQMIAAEVKSIPTPEGTGLFDWAFFGTVRYPISVLAIRARELEMQNDPKLAQALERAKAEAELDAGVAAMLAKLNITPADTEAYVSSKPEFDQDEPFLLVQRMFFYKQEDAEKALEMIESGATIENIVSELEIPSLTTRESRGSSTYYSETQLWEHLTELQFGKGIWDILSRLEEGETSGIVEIEPGRQIFRIKERSTTKDGVDLAVKERASRQLRMVLEANALAKFDAGLTLAAD